jgi:ornithine carbamoyltransferase
MSPNFKSRSLLALDELSAREIQLLLEMAHELKRAKNAGTERAQLRGKNIALLFEKASTRTRGAVEVAACDQGANVSFVGAGDSRLGEGEGISADMAGVLGRLYDAIDYRGSDQSVVRELAQHAGVPVYNGLTDPFHPTQILADYMTMQEQCPTRALSNLRLAYVGDARRNIGDSLLQGAAVLGMDFRVGAPRALWPPQALIDAAQKKAHEKGGRLRFTESAEDAVQEVDFVYTDFWVSMGEPEAVWAERVAQLKPYQVHAGLMRKTGNPEVKFLHCLPALHDRQTRKGEENYQKFGMDGLEVTDEVLESPASAVFDQAENRLHAIKALLVATLA